MCVHSISDDVDKEGLSHKVTFDQGPREGEEAYLQTPRSRVACSEVPRHMCPLFSESQEATEAGSKQVRVRGGT